MSARRLGFITVLALALNGCGLFSVPLEKPQTFVEQLYYAEASAQSAEKSILDLTCGVFKAGVCVEAAKPFSPTRGKEMLDRVSRARTGIKTAATLGPQGGKCLDKVVDSPQACLALAQLILTEVRALLVEMKGGAK